MADTPLPQTDAVVSNHDVTVDIENLGETDEVLELQNGGNKKDPAVDQAYPSSVLRLLKTIPRFPLNLQRFGKAMDLIAPRVVALGPYHHAKDKLLATEGVKRRVIDHFFQGSPSEQDKVRKEMMPIARGARSYYEDDAVQGIPDDEFCNMMFADGCFLVQFMGYMISRSEEKETSWPEPIIQLHCANIMSDIMLLENQIPWPVIDFLMKQRGLRMEQVIYWLTLAPSDIPEKNKLESIKSYVDFNVKPSHLLYLLHSCKVGISRPSKDSNAKPSHLSCLLQSCNVGCIKDPKLPDNQDNLSAICTGAAELAEMGIKLEACKARLFSGIKVVERYCIFAKLSLVPLSLDNSSASWLINMAAFEMCTATDWGAFNYINSYLSVVALLIEEEQDVIVLRTKRIITATMSNKQTLKFFKDLAPNLMEGQAYLLFIKQLEAYKRKRWLQITIHRFFYTNTKTIATVLSIIGVLVGIFKTLLSLKQN